MTHADVIPISSLQHYLYCRRQCALILVDGVWEENAHTVRGRWGHRRADDPGRRWERGRIVARSVPVWSEQLGLTGRADVVESYPNGELVPGEIKMGRRHGVTADVQLCAVALCLEEMLQRRIRRGFIWYGGLRRRWTVVLDERLREMTLATIREVAQLRTRPTLPPAHDDRRCQECQLLGHCMPSVVADPASVVAYIDRNIRPCSS